MKYIASTIVRASDIGLNDNLFGGTLLKWLDQYGALFTYKYLHHTFVTYKMQKTYFLKPAKQGDCIDFYVTNLKFSPISVNFDLVAKNNNANPAIEIINTNMTFVSIDIINKKKKYIDPFLFEQEQFEIYIKQKSFSMISCDQNIFHNQNHIKDMLIQLNMYKTSIEPIEYKRLFAAICYHDIEHDKLYDQNKDNCFERFKKDWQKIISKQNLDAVYEYIIATEYKISTNQLGQNKNSYLIHDLNMISFIDYEIMKNSDNKMKSEYSNITPKEFYEIRLKYFDYLLKNGVFISKQYMQYNSIAKQNIKTYMKQIKILLQQLKKQQN